MCITKWLENVSIFCEVGGTSEIFSFPGTDMEDASWCQRLFGLALCVNAAFIPESATFGAQLFSRYN